MSGCYHSGRPIVDGCPAGFYRLYPSDICCPVPQGWTVYNMGLGVNQIFGGKGTGKVGDPVDPNANRNLVNPGNPPGNTGNNAGDVNAPVGGSIGNVASGGGGATPAATLVPVDTGSGSSLGGLALVAAVIGIVAGALYLWHHFHKQAA